MQSPGISREASRPVSPSSESSSEVLPWSERRRVFGRRSKRALGAMSCGGFSTASSIASSGPPSSKSWRLPMTKGALATGMTGSRRTLRSKGLAVRVAHRPPVQRRFRTSMDLLEAAEQIMRQNLRRRHPEASPVEIEILLGRW